MTRIFLFIPRLGTWPVAYVVREYFRNRADIAGMNRRPGESLECWRRVDRIDEMWGLK